MATAGVDAGTRRGGCFPVRRLGWYVPKIIRSIESPGCNPKGVRVVHGVPHLDDHEGGESFLRMLADEDLWRLFEAIGVDAVHTGPVKRAGGISGWDVTPSVDGHFDRISTGSMRHSALRWSSGQCVRWRPRTEAPSSMTSCGPHGQGRRLSSGGDEGW
jgi:hypothetical protein